MGNTMSKVVDLPLKPAVASATVTGDHRTSLYVVCSCIFLLAFCIRVGLLYATRSYLETEHSELVLVAISLAKGHGFANAFGNTGPTAHMSPIYPLLLSLVYRSFGMGVAGEIAQELVSCFFASLTWALIPVLAEVCHLERRVGVSAAILGAVVTVNRWAETKGSSEAALSGLFCLLVVMFFARSWYTNSFSWRTGIYLGIVSGLAILVSASLGSIVFGLLVCGYVLFRQLADKRYLRFSLVVVVTVLLMLLPWALRNYFVLGSLIWTRSNLPLELMVSNNDYARPTLNQNEESGHRYHPFMSPQQRAIVKSIGEVAYQRNLKKEVFVWIQSHPAQFATLTLERIYYFWIPEMKRWPQTLFLALLLMVSGSALVLLLRQRQLIAYCVLAIWMTYPLVYYLIQAHPRYVYPIQWTLYFVSSAGAFTAYQKRKSERELALV
jgi:hypothetical protein